MDETDRLWSILKNGPDNKKTAERMEELLKTGKVSLEHKKNGDTFLSYAASRRNCDICSTLIKYKACVNFRNKDNKTPLVFACERGKGDICELLLENKAKINGLPEFTALFSDSHFNYASRYSITTLLLEHGASPHSLVGNDRNSYNITSPLLIKIARTFDPWHDSQKIELLALLVMKRIISKKDKAKTFMLCLYRLRTTNPCIQLLFKEGKSLLKKHVLRITREENRAILLETLKTRESEGKKPYGKAMLSKNAYEFWRYEPLNPANIDSTIQMLTQEK